MNKQLDYVYKSELLTVNPSKKSPDPDGLNRLCAICRNEDELL